MNSSSEILNMFHVSTFLSTSLVFFFSFPYKQRTERKKSIKIELFSVFFQDDKNLFLVLFFLSEQDQLIFDSSIDMLLSCTYTIFDRVLINEIYLPLDFSSLISRQASLIFIDASRRYLI